LRICMVVGLHNIATGGFSFIEVCRCEIGLALHVVRQAYLIVCILLKVVATIAVDELLVGEDGV
jgi:hypothetical protein